MPQHTIRTNLCLFLSVLPSSGYLYKLFFPRTTVVAGEHQMPNKRKSCKLWQFDDGIVVTPISPGTDREMTCSSSIPFRYLELFELNWNLVITELSMLFSSSQSMSAGSICLEFDCHFSLNPAGLTAVVTVFIRGVERNTVRKSIILYCYE